MNAKFGAEKSNVIWVAQLILAIALGLALFLCFYKLGDVPPALNGDEAAFGSGALELLENGPQLYIEGQGGGGVLASYVVAFFYLLSEPGKMPLRFQTSLFGVLTVLTTFFTTRALFQAEGKEKATLVAALAALLLALNPTYITISRIAFAIAQLPLLELLAVFLFWTALVRRQPWRFVMAGFALALVFYGYIAGAVMPAIIGAFLVLAFAARLIDRRRDAQPSDGGSGFPSWRNLGLYAVAFGVGILPLILFYIGNLDAGSTGRMGEASFMNPNISGGNPWGALWYGLWGNYTAFGLRPLVWLAAADFGRFVAEPVSLLYFIGLAIALIRFRRPPMRFLLLWWGITILPAALAPTEVPHPSRAYGVFAPLSILASLPLAELGLFAGRQLSQWRERKIAPLALFGGAAAWLILAWILFTAARQTVIYYDYYFNEFSFRKDILAGFDAWADDLADDMATIAEPGSAFILLRDTAAGSISPNGSVNFYYRLSNSPAPHYWVADDETTLPAELTEIAADVQTLHVVSWTITKHSGADPKSVLPYYLEKYGVLAQSRSFGDYTIDTWRLPRPGIDFAAAESLTAADVSFDGLVSLTGTAFGNAGPGEPSESTVAAGQPVWLRLRWLKTADHPQDLKVSILLLNADGVRLLSLDKHLENNYFHQRSRAWDVGSEEETYFLLPLPADLMPGDYTLAALVYDDETLTPRPVFPANAPWADLGRISVAPPIQPSPVSESKGTRVSDDSDPLYLFVPEATIPADVVPGKAVSFPLTWHAPQTPSADYALVMKVRDEDGAQTDVLPVLPIGGDDYPTSLWRPGETLTQWITFRLPSGLSGRQTLLVQLFDGTNLLAEWPLFTLKVTDWPREFELPAVENLTPVGASLGPSIELAAYGLAIAPEGEAINLTLFWRAVAPIAEDYVAFAHLLDANGQVAAQMDQPPGGGVKPMTGWMVDEVVAGELTLSVPPELERARARLVVGLYSPQTFRRLTVMQNGEPAGDFIEIPLSIE